MASVTIPAAPGATCPTICPLGGGKRRKGRSAHIAVDTLGPLLSVVITPANEQERAQVGDLCRQVQQVTGQTVQVGFVA
jgi:hypothetical protein